MAPRVKTNRALLEVLHKAKPALVRAIIEKSDREIIYTICEICDNLLRGNIPLTESQKAKLKRYRVQIRNLAQKGGSLQKKKKIILQRGGALPILPILISALASVLPSLVKAAAS